MEGCSPDIVSSVWFANFMKHTYTVQTYYLGSWLDIVRDTRDFCLGFLHAKKDYSPRNAYRLMRGDGKVMHELPAADDVAIGQVASMTEDRDRVVGYLTTERKEHGQWKADADAQTLAIAKERDDLRAQLAEAQLEIDGFKNNNRFHRGHSYGYREAEDKYKQHVAAEAARAEAVEQQLVEAKKDSARLHWLSENRQSIPYLEDGLWKIPYLMDGAGGFGGGVGEVSGRILAAVIDAAMQQEGQQ